MESLIEYWKNIKDRDVRRQTIFNQMPKEWDNNKKLFHTGLALDKISNCLKNKSDKIKAKKDSEYYFKKLNKLKDIGI